MITNNKLDNILSKRPNWSTVEVLLQDNIVKSGHFTGRLMVVKLDGKHFVIYDGALNLYSYNYLSNDELEEVLADIEEF